MTTRRPEDHDPVPNDCVALYDSAEHWILEGTTLCHNVRFNDMGPDFNLFDIEVGQSAGFVVTKDGELRFQVNGKERVGWTGLPTDKPLWGIFDVDGKVNKIRLSVFGESEKHDVLLLIIINK